MTGTSSPHLGGPTPQEQFMHLLTGAWISQSLYAVALLGIADLLKEGPHRRARARSGNQDAPRRCCIACCALASIAVFTEHDDHTFGLTPLANCLLSDVPGSQRPAAIMMGEEHYRAWAELLYSIETGLPAFDKLHGQPIFSYLAHHEVAAKIFDGAMTGIHGAETRAMLDAYDFSAFATLVDVGGGNGSLLCTVLERYPQLHGILFDRPDVIERPAKI